jgi:hypothetical protein
MGLLIVLFRIDMVAVEPAFRTAPRRAAGIFLIAVSLLFTLMWLGMIVPGDPGRPARRADRLRHREPGPPARTEPGTSDRDPKSALEQWQVAAAGLSNRPPTLGLVEWMADTGP